MADQEAEATMEERPAVNGDAAPEPGPSGELNSEYDGPVTRDDAGTPVGDENPAPGPAGEDDDSDDDDVQIEIGQIQTNLPFQPKTQQPQGKQTQKLDIDAVAQIQGKNIFEQDLESIEDKPWRKPGADITDFFNYGFTEQTWTLYCERQRKLRTELGTYGAANKQLFSGPGALAFLANATPERKRMPMPMPMPGQGLISLGGPTPIPMPILNATSMPVRIPAPATSIPNIADAILRIATSSAGGSGMNTFAGPPLVISHPPPNANATPPSTSGRGDDFLQKTAGSGPPGVDEGAALGSDSDRTPVVGAKPPTTAAPPSGAIPNFSMPPPGVPAGLTIPPPGFPQLTGMQLQPPPGTLLPPGAGLGLPPGTFMPRPGMMPPGFSVPPPGGRFTGPPPGFDPTRPPVPGLGGMGVAQRRERSPASYSDKSDVDDRSRDYRRDRRETDYRRERYDRERRDRDDQRRGRYAERDRGSYSRRRSDRSRSPHRSRGARRSRSRSHSRSRSPRQLLERRPVVKAEPEDDETYGAVGGTVEEPGAEAKEDTPGASDRKKKKRKKDSSAEPSTSHKKKKKEKKDE